MPFSFLSCLIALASTSSTVLNKNGESRHSCLVSDPRRGEHLFFFKSRKFSSILSFLRVYHTWLLNSLSVFSASIDVIV